MPIENDSCVLFLGGRWIAVSIAIEETQDFMKGSFSRHDYKHLSTHFGAIVVAKIFSKLHFRMALVILPSKSTYESNDNYL